METEIFSPVSSLRHELHTCNDYCKWFSMIEQLTEYIQDEELPKLQLPNITDPCDISCERDDCGYDNCEWRCEFCDEKEKEYLGDIKEEVNSILEEYLRDCEKQFDFEENSIAPTGIARMRWMGLC